MKISFDQIQWHDAEITEMSLVSAEDSFDRLTLKLESDAFLADFGQEQITLVMSDCYRIRADLNLWIKGKDSISTANMRSDSLWIEDEKRRLVNGFGPREMFHFEIITHTNSKIEALFSRQDCIDLEVPESP